MCIDYWARRCLGLYWPIGWVEAAMSEIWYDHEEDILGIQVAHTKCWKSVEVSKNVVVDLAEDSEIIGWRSSKPNNASRKTRR